MENDPPDHPLRLFLAAEIPAGVAVIVEEAFAPWRAAIPGVRWIPARNWHVTLKFLGAVAPDLVAWIGERLDAVGGACSPFSVRVAGVGAFPSARRAKVLWAGLEDGGDSLALVAAAISAALAPRFAPESRPFSAHLTVGRCDPPVGLPDLFSFTDLVSETWRIGQIGLYQSHLMRPFPAYERLSVFPLGR